MARNPSPLRDRWDFTLLDSPSALGQLAINALTATDSVLVPVEAHGIALAGLADLVNTVDLVREEGLNRTRNIDHVLACRVDRTRQAREAVEVLREQFPAAMLRTVIRESARLADNFNFRTTILKHAPRAQGQPTTGPWLGNCSSVIRLPPNGGWRPTSEGSSDASTSRFPRTACGPCAAFRRQRQARRTNYCLG